MKKPHQLRMSVVVPTYGRNQVLVDTLTQLLDQDFKEFELIVVDQTAEHEPATQQFLADCKDPRFRYFLIGPPSLPAARNFAATVAQTELIVYLDDDIVIEPNFLSLYYRAFQEHPDAVAIGGRVINKNDTQELVHRPLYFDRYALGRSTFNCDTSQYAESFPGGNMAVRKKALLAIKGFDTSYQKSAVREESDTAFRLRQQGGKIYFESQASILHLAAPMGGTRIFVHPFDNLQFYTTDLLFALKSVRWFNLPVSLAVRYRDALRHTSFSSKLRRSGLFIAGLLRALRFWVWPANIVAKQLGTS